MNLASEKSNTMTSVALVIVTAGFVFSPQVTYS